MDKRPDCIYADSKSQPKKVFWTTVFCKASGKLLPLSHCEKCTSLIPKAKKSEGGGY